MRLNSSQKVNQIVVLAQVLLERIDNLSDKEDTGKAYRLIEHLEAYLMRQEASIDSND